MARRPLVRLADQSEDGSTERTPGSMRPTSPAQKKIADEMQAEFWQNPALRAAGHVRPADRLQQTDQTDVPRRLAAILWTEEERLDGAR